MDTQVESNVTVMGQPVLNEKEYDLLSKATEATFEGHDKIDDGDIIDWSAKTREFVLNLNERGYFIAKIEDRDRS